MIKNIHRLPDRNPAIYANVNNQYSAIIVEDEPNTLARLKVVIDQTSDIHLIGGYATFNEGLDALKKYQPDILITDLGLPDGDGIDLIRAVQDFRMKTQAMVISVFGDESHVIEAIKAGACGYLLKDGKTESIVGSIREMLKGGAPISPSIASYLLRKFRGEDYASLAVTNADNLTKTEKSVLQLVSKGYTSREIGSLNNVSYHTVTTHVKNIYRKLSINSRAEATVEAIKLGLVA